MADLTGLGSIADFAKGIVDRFFPPDATPEQKLAAQQALESSIAARDNAKAQIMTAELQQDDKFTKRSRPTIVYSGLGMIAINYVVFPVISRVLAILLEAPDKYASLLQPINLPSEFWVAWGGVISVYVLGRSAEKRGTTGNIGKLASLITGGQK